MIKKMFIGFIIIVFFIPFYFEIEFWPLASYRMYMWYKSDPKLDVYRFCEKSDHGQFRLIAINKYWANVFMYNLNFSKIKSNEEIIRESLSSHKWKGLVSENSLPCFVKKSIHVYKNQMKFSEEIIF